MLIDSGANVDCKPEMLRQFGVMGSIYMEKVMNVSKPRVGLANIGTEEHKGGELQQEAYRFVKRIGATFCRKCRGAGDPRRRGRCGRGRWLYRQHAC